MSKQFDPDSDVPSPGEDSGHPEVSLGLKIVVLGVGLKIVVLGVIPVPERERLRLRVNTEVPAPIPPEPDALVPSPDPECGLPLVDHDVPSALNLFNSFVCW
jgi:hypothetical protein